MRRQLTGTASSARAAAVKEPGPANLVPPAAAAYEAQPRPAHAAAEGRGAAIVAPADDAAAKQAAEPQAQQQQAGQGTAVQLSQVQADAGALRGGAAVPAQDGKPPTSTVLGPAASHEPQPMVLDSPPQMAQPAGTPQDPPAPAALEEAGCAVTTAAAPVGPGQAAAPAAEPAAAQGPAAAHLLHGTAAALAPGAAAPAAAQDVDKLLASDEVLPAPEAMQDDNTFPKQEAGMGDDEKHAVAALLAAASGVSSGDAAAMQDLQAGLGAAGQTTGSIPDCATHGSQCGRPRSAAGGTWKSKNPPCHCRHCR